MGSIPLIGDVFFLKLFIINPQATTLWHFMFYPLEVLSVYVTPNFKCQGEIANICRIVITKLVEV